MNAGSLYHYPANSDSRVPLCGATLTKWVSPLPTTKMNLINCPACRSLLSLPSAAPEFPRVVEVSPVEDLRRRWTVACVGGETNLGFREWMIGRDGVGSPTLHKPPLMNERDSGVFEFYDVDFYNDKPCSLEVVPQTTGNVEITLGDTFFNLSHLDRADMIRALLHDFHYSPERGGPNDDQD